uniref:F-box domain-containing protein n=3 Tax=Aegilops tauschii subsp. strangulata TaxID=200361 RepID=A0A453GGI6_AEGTS
SLRRSRSKHLTMSSSSPRTAMARDSKKKKKKRLKGSPVSKLTDDILADIISRVPYKSTCCCQCVSTRWRDLISHREHQKKMPQSIAGFFHEGSNAFRSPRNARYFTNLSRQRYPLVDPSLSFLPDCERLDILDGCNGLLLCHCWMAVDPMAFYYYVVCNPTTGKWVAVPATDGSSMVSVARLVFDPAVSSHFQVFEFIDEQSRGIAEDELDADCCGRIEALAIYSSKTGAWKYQTVEHGPFVIPENSVSAFFNGILHLPAYECVVAVDVEGANWWLVDVPEPPYYADCIGGVFPSQGHLYFAESDRSKLSVWVLEDYVTGKWTLKHNVSHLHLFGREYSSFADYYSVISIHPEHGLIFIVSGEEKTLMSYDMDSGELCILRQLGWECRPPYVPYVRLFSESLGDEN